MQLFDERDLCCSDFSLCLVGPSEIPLNINDVLFRHILLHFSTSRVGGVSSTSALISEARIGAVIGSIFSLLALSFKTLPRSFSSPVSFDDMPS